ncbi:hypothetical protein QNO07_20535 [Streptomyces sp. 549]|uniref:hypothetical protein n=1 Tax=Streptomyces sp. 549 TaxID=3049076 RepID=UPI0024C43FFD|nr:hypothetical protein [Streptomyces sp. 549]MDK1475776.1 hypothetical protein [Streptomyces sp. 549]
MSAISLTLLVAAGVAATLGGAALHTARGLRREVIGLREELAAAGAAAVPAARRTPVVEDVRAAVADALAEERERELAEARAFWAAQEARESDLMDAGPLLATGGAEFAEYGDFGERAERGEGVDPSDEHAVGAVDAALLEALLDEAREGQAYLPRQSARDAAEAAAPAEAGAEAAERAAARRRHPSDPHFSLSGEPTAPDRDGTDAAADDERTMLRLAELAEARTELADVRPGPLGTLDVYVFTDGTTVCMSPGHRETAERLAQALRAGDAPYLLGGSGVSGAFALTFAYGDESVYVLADRVIASL